MLNLRHDFPILAETIRDKPLVYLDNAATTQKPQVMIDALVDYYSHNNANIHRGVHYLSEKATAQYEDTRTLIKSYINANSTKEIIFTRGTTEAINLVASTFGHLKLQAGDEILLSTLEHHSNIVPWQLIAQEKGASIKVIPMNQQGELCVEQVSELLSDKTKIVALSHISNALGTINPIETIITMAHAKGIPVLIDGAQAAPHLAIDVQALDCDFYTFSSHKFYGPTGVGILYAKETWLSQLPPYQGGGDMIKQVTFNQSTYHDLPYKFEAGTPNIADVIAWAASIRYIQSIGITKIAEHEQQLRHYAESELIKIPGLTLIGTATHKAAVISFVLQDIHPHDIGTLLDAEGIAVRTGHHCAMPIMNFFNVPATVRASLALYNTADEIDQLCKALQQIIKLFAR